MKQTLTRLVGFVLIAGAILGLTLSVAGLVILPRVERMVTTRALAGLDLLDRTLAATADGLSVADEALGRAVDSVALLQTTTQGVSQAIGDTVPLVDTVADMMGEDLPESIRAAQTALTAAQSSAKLADDTLSLLAAVPLLGLGEYAPAVPLHTGLGHISDSLGSLPASFSQMEQGLKTSSGNLARIEGDVAGLADQIGQIDSSLAQTRSVVTQYQSVVGDLQVEVAALRDGLPRWLRWLRWGLSLGLIWLGIAQLGLLSQGLEMVRRTRAGESQEPA